MTIIAIFAGIAELSGTVVLPFLNPDVQAIFVWFVMTFPSILVILFFTTLLTKHHVLYAPSDYKDDETFKSTFNVTKASKEEVKNKVINEQNDNSLILPDSPDSGILPPVVDSPDSPPRDLTPAVDYREIENQIFDLLSVEIGQDIERDTKVNFGGSKDYIFDGSFLRNGELSAFELLKYNGPITRRRIDTLVSSIVAHSEGDAGKFILNIVLYSNNPNIRKPDLDKIRNELSYAKFPIYIRYIPLDT